MDISVITAVYNKESILVEYSAHTLAQKGVDFELIFVDDCSPDNCPKILDDLARTHSNIRVIHRDKNGGHVAAVNTGISAARGKYIFIVDADDYLNYEYALCDMLNIARTTNADIVFSDFLGKNECVFDKDLYTEREFLLKMLNEGWYHPTLRSRLYKADVFKNNLINNYIIDDEEWTLRTLFTIGYVAFYPKQIYTRTTPDSSITRNNSIKTYFIKSRDRILVSRKLIDNFDKINLSANDKKSIYTRILNLFMMAINIRILHIDDLEMGNAIDDLIVKNIGIMKYSKYCRKFKYRVFYVLARCIGVKMAMKLYAISINKNKGVKK